MIMVKLLSKKSRAERWLLREAGEKIEPCNLRYFENTETNGN